MPRRRPMVEPLLVQVHDSVPEPTQGLVLLCQRVDIREENVDFSLTVYNTNINAANDINHTSDAHAPKILVDRTFKVGHVFKSGSRSSTNWAPGSSVAWQEVKNRVVRKWGNDFSSVEKSNRLGRFSRLFRGVLEYFGIVKREVFRLRVKRDSANYPSLPEHLRLPKSRHTPGSETWPQSSTVGSSAPQASSLEWEVGSLGEDVVKFINVAPPEKRSEIWTFLQQAAHLLTYNSSEDVVRIAFQEPTLQIFGEDKIR